MFRLPIAAAVVAGCIVGAAGAARAQTNAEILVRIDQLENQLRQLTGIVEQVQYRNQQLEATLRRMQEDAGTRVQEGRAAAPPAGGPARSSPPSPSVPVIPAAPSGRRSDAFDPATNPAAPGVPRSLGSIYGNASVPRGEGGAPVIASQETERRAGAPLDIGALASAQSADAGFARGRNPAPTTTEASLAGAPPTLPPSATPRDTFDLGYGYLQRRDYALAEETFRDFLHKYPSDRQAGEAEYFLGESLFSRQSYRDAADAFLTVSKKFDTSAKAPDALLRLGQSLAALNEKDLACATFAEIGHKYPRAPATVKQSAEREQKRVHC